MTKDTADKKKVRKRKTTQSVTDTTFPEKSILDTVKLDIGDIKLTEKEIKFVFWYTYPGSEAFQCQAKAARKAGYNSPVTTGYKLRNKENVAKAIKHVLDKKLKINLEEEFHKILKLKQQRIHYDIGDYVEKKTKTIQTKSGESFEVECEELKDISELTEEQRLAIDGIDYKGVQGIKVYTFADRDKAMNDLLNIYSKITQDENSNGDYDVELTYDIIKEKLSVKAAIRNKKKVLAEKANFIDEGVSNIEEL